MMTMLQKVFVAFNKLIAVPNPESPPSYRFAENNKRPATPITNFHGMFM